MHCLTCIFYLVALIDGLENSWISEVVNKGFSTHRQYVVSLYFVLTTIFTIGFGEIHPMTTTERVICVFFQIMGVFFECLIISKMVQLIRDSQTNRFVKRATTVRDFLLKKKIDSTKIRHVRYYYQNVWEKTHGSLSCNGILKDLPSSIRCAVALEFCQKAFSKIKLFNGLPERYLIIIVDSMREFLFCPGECIYHQGDPSNDLMIFRDGII